MRGGGEGLVKSHDSDMLLICNGPYLRRAKDISSYQKAGGASRRAGVEIPW